MDPSPDHPANLHGHHEVPLARNVQNTICTGRVFHARCSRQASIAVRPAEYTRTPIAAAKANTSMPDISSSGLYHQL